MKNSVIGRKAAAALLAVSMAIGITSCSGASDSSSAAPKAASGSTSTAAASKAASSAASTAAASKAAAKSSADNTLYVYNWGEYIGEDVVAKFEKETGIKVVYDTFETNEEMYPIIEAGAVKYDVVCPSDYIIEKMIKNNLLQPIDFNNVPNIKNIDRKYLDKSKAFDPENKYSVPYCWGTVGIIYNTSMVDPADAPTSWNDLWNEKYKGNILMQDSVRDAFMVGEKLLGYNVNTTDKTELEKVRDLLIKQKPLVQAYVVDQVRDKMIGGEAAMAVIYSGEMLYIQNEVKDSGADYELKYVIPKEGSNVWFDNWVIPKNAQHKANAEKWIDFMCRADIAKDNFDYITYPTPNKAAFDLLDKDLQENKAVFPDDDMLAKCDVYKYLGDEGDELYDSLWKQLKAD
jgi:spermidine/putrescine transport system substrate-binding protein